LPFNASTEVDLVDTFTGDGSTQTFPLTNKVANRVGQTVQYGGIELYKYNGGFTVNDDNTVTLSTTPPLSAEGVIPGITNLPVGLLFDQDDVPGVSNPRVIETPFWLADPDNIGFNKYEGLPGSSGIALTVIDLISGAGAVNSWCQLACAQADTLGSAWVYGVTGGTIYTNDISTFSTIQASSDVNSNTLYVWGASDFQLGDYIKLADSTSTQEIVRITDYIAPYELTVSSTTYQHFPDETIYTCGRKFWLKTTVPLDAVDNTASSFYDLVIQKVYAVESRL